MTMRLLSLMLLLFCSAGRADEPSALHEEVDVLRSLAFTGGTIHLGKTFAELTKAFKGAGIDVSAIEEEHLGKWEKDADAGKFLEYQEELGAAIARAVKAKAESKDPVVLTSLKELEALVSKLKHGGYRNMRYEEEDLETFQRSLVAPLLANRSNGRNFALGSYLASQDICLVCSAAAMRRATP